MTADFLPLRLLLATLAGWVNRHQQYVIDYLMEENQALREQLRGRRVQLTDDQRRRLAAKGQRLGRRVLRQVATIVTPDTILRWYRRLIAQNWTSEYRRPGRPGLMKEIAALIVRMATDNPAWGYSRIQGALKNLDHRVAEKYGRQGPQGQWDPAGARAAFIVAELYAGALGRDCRGRLLHDGSVDCSRSDELLHAIRAGSREPVEIVGSTRNPDATFMAQAARRLTDAVDGFLVGHRVLICDRDGKWTDGFRALLEGAGVRTVRTPVQGPNANAYAERFVRSIREECLDRLILFGERRLRHALKEFVVHYHQERNHQGLANDLIAPAPRAVGHAGTRCRERLGGHASSWSWHVSLQQEAGAELFDALTALEQWVEDGRAPEGIVATKYANDDPTQAPERMMPLCSFPKQARYTGTGDVHSAASWTCTVIQDLLQIDPNGIAAGLTGPMR